MEEYSCSTWGGPTSLGPGVQTGWDRVYKRARAREGRGSPIR